MHPSGIYTHEIHAREMHVVSRIASYRCVSLTGVYLTGVHLIGVHLSQACIVVGCIEQVCDVVIVLVSVHLPLSLSARYYVQFLCLDLLVVVTHCCLYSSRQQQATAHNSRQQQATAGNSSEGTSRHQQHVKVSMFLTP